MDTIKETSMKTEHDTWYDLDPESADLHVVAGPAGARVEDIDPDNLPAGFRWVEDGEWEAHHASHAEVL